MKKFNKKNVFQDDDEFEDIAEIQSRQMDEMHSMGGSEAQTNATSELDEVKVDANLEDVNNLQRQQTTGTKKKKKKKKKKAPVQEAMPDQETLNNLPDP